MVGDEKTRENYYNAKLIRGNHYQIIIGVKSVGKFLTKYAFSNNSDLTFTPFLTHDSQGPTLLELVFYVAITIMVILIIMVIVAFVILKRKITARNRQHLSDNQELTLQGPMIDMVNINAIIVIIFYYIPRNFRKITVISTTTIYQRIIKKR